jgi:tRNA isopentenyl-2-thiomethyl-A-37 hydroxylase MiaE
VGREMVTSTDDNVLRQDMPSALQKVESAAKLLEEAAKMSQASLNLVSSYFVRQTIFHQMNPIFQTFLHHFHSFVSLFIKPFSHQFLFSSNPIFKKSFYHNLLCVF